MQRPCGRHKRDLSSSGISVAGEVWTRQNLVGKELGVVSRGQVIIYHEIKAGVLFYL